MTIPEIVRALCDLTDGATMSAKKDALVNIGGFLALNDDDLFDAARNMVVVYEGLHTYGGMAGRDMEAVSIGIRESVEYDHIKARVGQVALPRAQAARKRACRSSCRSASHAVFLDARAFLPHLDQDVYPAQALAAAIYLDSGVRTMERGNVSSGRDPATGENRQAEARARPESRCPGASTRQAHMDVTAESIVEVYEHRDEITGLRMVYEPPQSAVLPGPIEFEPWADRGEREEAARRGREDLAEYRGRVTFEGVAMRRR